MCITAPAMPVLSRCTVILVKSPAAAFITGDMERNNLCCSVNRIFPITLFVASNEHRRKTRKVSISVSAYRKNNSTTTFNTISSNRFSIFRHANTWTRPNRLCMEAIVAQGPGGAYVTRFWRGRKGRYSDECATRALPQGQQLSGQCGEWARGLESMPRWFGTRAVAATENFTGIRCKHTAGCASARPHAVGLACPAGAST